MANINGARTTDAILEARRVVDMAEKIALLDPNLAPFLTILKRTKGGKGSRVVHNPKFSWLEDDYLGYKTTVGSAVSGAGVTTVTVADGSIVRPNDVLNIPSVGENMLVTAVSGNDLTVVRGFGETAAAATIDADAEVYIIGNAQKENANARERKSTQEVEKFNYTQIFRTPIELSNTEAASKLYGGKDRATQRFKAMQEHKRDIALAMYFGQLKNDTAASRRTMKGLVPFMEQVQAFSSSGTPLDWKNFNKEVAQKAFLHGSDEKLLVAGPMLAAAIDGWDIAGIKTTPGTDKTYGVHVTKLVTTYGILNVVREPLFDGAVYSGYGLVLDMENIRYAYLEGRDTKLNTNIQANDQDGVMDEYLTECSLEVKNPKTHMLITGAYV